MFQAILPTPQVWWDSELFAGWVKSSFDTMGIDLCGEFARARDFSGSKYESCKRRNNGTNASVIRCRLCLPRALPPSPILLKPPQTRVQKSAWCHTSRMILIEHLSHKQLGLEQEQGSTSLHSSRVGLLPEGRSSFYPRTQHVFFNPPSESVAGYLYRNH